MSIVKILCSHLSAPITASNNEENAIVVALNLYKHETATERVGASWLASCRYSARVAVWLYDIHEADGLYVVVFSYCYGNKHPDGNEAYSTMRALTNAQDSFD